MGNEKDVPIMDQPARIDVSLISSIPPAENLKGVLCLSGRENFLEVEIVTLFGVWKGFWLLKGEEENESGKEVGEKL